MERSQHSRDFSARVQTNFHRQGDPFRFRMWLVTSCFGITACAGLLWNGVFGSPEIYSAGELTAPHHMFERRCEACHVPFAGPMERLVSLGGETNATSAPDEKCLACHDGAGHFFVGDPMLDYDDRYQERYLAPGHERNCAECHREHGSQQDLRRISSQFCIECHRSMEAFAETSDRIGALTFQDRGATSIEDFAHHPEFAIHRLANGGDRNVPKSHGANAVVAQFLRQGEKKTRWQDRAAIRFNHSKHLSSKDPRGIPDARGEFHDLSNDCSSCHELDSERRVMKPVNFEMHCSSCHPLVFDTDRVRKNDGSLFRIDWDSNGASEGLLRNELDADDVHNISELKAKDSPFELLVVPHESPEQVRGFLTDIYAKSLLQKLKSSQPGLKSGTAVRPIPGSSGNTPPPRLIEPEQLGQVFRQVGQAESLIRAGTFRSAAEDEIPKLFRTLHWLRSSGGCGFCHESSEDADGNWAIRKPNIPDVWFRHAKFRHDAHRILKCVECHSSSGSSSDIVKEQATLPDIYSSSSTGDILMPGIALCKSCHNALPAEESGQGGARTDCLECHVYHKRDFEKPRNWDLKKFSNVTPDSRSAD